MNEQFLAATRRALHGVAESVIAGPQYRADGTIRLKVTPDGFAGVTSPLRVQGKELVGPDGRWPLGGTLRELGHGRRGRRRAGRRGSTPIRPVWTPTNRSAFDAGAVELLEDWFARGDAALRAFAPESAPVLWPEHFDLGDLAGRGQLRRLAG